MDKKRMVIVGLLILIAVPLAATACYNGDRVGELQIKSQNVELSDAGSVKVDLQMGAGELDVTGGASDLLEASFTYNVDKLDPQATYAGDRLVIKDSDVNGGVRSLFDLGEYRNEWDLKFNEDVSLEMDIDLGAGSANLALGALDLTRLDINGGAGDVQLDLNSSPSLRLLYFDMGAGETTIDLAGEWQNDLDAILTGGLGTISLRLPDDVGLFIKAKTGIGGVDAGGLSREGNTYTNDAYGVSDVTLRIDIEGGVGQINLDVE